MASAKQAQTDVPAQILVLMLSGEALDVRASLGCLDGLIRFLDHFDCLQPHHGELRPSGCDGGGRWTHAECMAAFDIEVHLYRNANAQGQLSGLPESKRLDRREPVAEGTVLFKGFRRHSRSEALVDLLVVLMLVPSV